MVITYISWAPHCSRSDATARELGGTSHMVYWGWLGSHPATILFKYLGQILSTFRLLAAEGPDCVFVMTPPVIAVLPVYIFCALKRRPFVIDAHSGAFQNPRWRRFWRLQYWLCRRAATTIVSNQRLADLVESRGGRATIVPDVPIVFENAIARPSDRFTVVCVTSFDRDEPIEVMLEAARRLPHVDFMMTGSRERAARRIATTLPANLTLTGFLANDSYGSLLQSAHVVMTLTTMDNTMQRGAYEAIYQGRPVIVSDFPILREAFPIGAVHIDNSPEGISAAIAELMTNHEEYVRQAGQLREAKLAQWRARRDELRRLIEAPRVTRHLARRSLR